MTVPISFVVGAEQVLVRFKDVGVIHGVWVWFPHILLVSMDRTAGTVIIVILRFVAVEGTKNGHRVERSLYGVQALLPYPSSAAHMWTL